MPRIFQLLTLAVMAGLLAGAMYVSGSRTPSAESPIPPVLTATGHSSQASMDDSLSSKPFVLIELFTSEGCSSCPSADRNLEKITAQAKASGQNIYTLSYHVDYWDYLGWKDPYATEQFSDRQRSYARQFKSSRIYTPQMVVNGKTEFVGSNQKASQQAIKQALVSQTTSAIAVTSSIKNKTVGVHWKVEGLGQQDQVQVALIQNKGQQKVRRGENARRTLTHVNIVRAHKTISNPGAEGQLEFSLPSGLSLHTSDAPSTRHRSEIDERASIFSNAIRPQQLSYRNRGSSKELGHLLRSDVVRSCSFHASSEPRKSHGATRIPNRTAFWQQQR